MFTLTLCEVALWQLNQQPIEKTPRRCFALILTTPPGFADLLRKNANCGASGTCMSTGTYAASCPSANCPVWMMQG